MNSLGEREGRDGRKKGKREEGETEMKRGTEREGMREAGGLFSSFA